ncbi:MAG: type 1 glutamine amidotransferase [Saprospiraceae bacterium]
MVRVAILDMNNNVPNLGLGNIVEIVKDFSDEVESQVFDVRHKGELPDTTWDIYISSGGPGDPLDGDGVWDKGYYDLMDALLQHNQIDSNKKYAFFICHSFQMMVDHLEVAEIVPRRSMSFGTFPVHKTEDGEKDTCFRNLPDPFYVADFRHWQILNPNVERLEETGATILALEKIRPHVDLERAIMAIRFSDEFFGTQFHPEADPIGMLKRFRESDKYNHVVKNYGEEKYQRMIDDLHHPEKMGLTHDMVLPTFLKDAIRKVKRLKAVEIEHLV